VGNSRIVETLSADGICDISDDDVTVFYLTKMIEHLHELEDIGLIYRFLTKAFFPVVYGIFYLLEKLVGYCDSPGVTKRRVPQSIQEHW
jgi:hypothetical protein